MNKFDFVSETERLIIRPLKEDDYKNWLNEFKNRHPSQHKYDKGKIDMSECTEEWFADLVKKHQELAYNDTAHVFGVFRKDDGTHLGMIDFSTLARHDFQWGRIGYTIHNQYWRKGYAKEAVREAFNIAFRDLNFHRIEAHINIGNTPSINLAKSVGMEFECTRKGFIFEFGEWTDHLVYYINSK
ncbi:GNAT family N-acetyltransferase [Pseudalkalibacillus salsuginis]|uniref:GNAT family N-acetyltransferase n=1 Tax=Pseudalkalibacillus salsuginis TaxID=2910972 RepID=UPI003899BFF4